MKRNAVTIATLQTFLDLAAPSNPDSPIKAAHIERTIAEPVPVLADPDHSQSR